MPSKKKKYNARFPAGRIKKIMQTDEEVGKVAQAVPIIISRTLELFVHSLLTKAMEITSAKNARTLTPSHMKQCILSESRFDFLKDLVKGIPDVSTPDEEVPTPPLTPAPMFINSFPLVKNTEQEHPKDIGTSYESHYDRRATKEEREVINVPLIESVKPEFQISIPAGYNTNQPNFYTELNPMNVNSNKLVAENQPMTNFTHTSNIDEDYDT